MKNIRSYLQRNGYISNNNIEHYDYLIKAISHLPFKNKNDVNNEKEIKKICKKNKKYKDFNKYFIST